MNDLLKLAIDGHGGMHRWEQLSRFRAAASITGAIWALKGKPGLLEDVVLDGETRDQRLTITPFPQPGRYTTWEPYRQTIETSDGAIAAERRDPAASFAGLTRHSPWDDLQVADTIVAHTTQQSYYFDDTGLLRRLDYSVGILGGGPAVHYPSQYREFDGIMVPTRRRVYVRNPDGSPVRDSVSIAIDVTNVTFS
jgi:hypothetical protein